MSITVNTIGANSRQLVIFNELSSENIINAINTSLVALGWTLHDSLTSGVLNCLVTKVYSAPNNDVATGGPTTKYLILRFDSPKQFWYVSCCEYWNNTTHIATNECFTNGRCIPLPLQYSNTTLYVFASARYAAFMGVVNGENSPWQGVFEFEREAPEDTATLGYPCFGWTSSLTIGEPYYVATVASATYGPTPFVFSLPRSRSGNTGIAAAAEMVISTSYGTFPPTSNVGGLGNYVGGITNAINTHNGQLGSFSQAYKWDSGKKIASSLKLAGFKEAYNVGRIYGLTVIPPTGNILDTVVVPYDANMFFDPQGVNANSFLLGINGGYSDTIAIGSNRLVVTTLALGPHNGVMYQMLVLKGNYIYSVSSSGLCKYDISTSTYYVLATGAFIDIIYDGNNYIYYTTTTGVSKLDINSETISNLACGTGGCQSLAIDDTYLYASHRNGTTAPKIDIINISTFSVERTHTSQSTYASTVFSALITCDYNGYVFASNVPLTDSSGATNTRIHKIKGSDGVSSYSPILTSAVASSTSGVMYWDGSNIICCYGASTSWRVDCFNTSLQETLTVSSSSDTRTGRSVQSNTPLMFKGYSWLNNGSVGSPIGNKLQTSYTAIGNIGTVVNIFYSNGYSYVSDGCCLFSGSSTQNMYKISNAYNAYNNSGQPTANILIPA